MDVFNGSFWLFLEEKNLTILLFVEFCFSVRLVNGRVPHEGQVQVYFGCAWREIHASDWDMEKANIVCRQLGYQSAWHTFDGAYFPVDFQQNPACLQSCTGDESNIAQCRYHNLGLRWEYCRYHQYAGVRCLASPPRPGKIITMNDIDFASF